MTVNLDKIDAVPFFGSNLPSDFVSWVSILVDTLNEIIINIENELNRYDNGLYSGQFTTAQIASLSPTADNGTFWYDSDTNQLKCKVNGAVTVIA
jgi:hypothetical protein